MAYNSTIRDNIFERLGKYVKWHYDLKDEKTSLETLRTAAIAEFVGDPEKNSLDESHYAALCNEMASQIDQMGTMQTSIKSLVSSFLTDYVKDQLDVQYSTTADILDYLSDKIGEADDHVLVNSHSVASAVEADLDNASAPPVPTLSTTELARPYNHFSLVCADNSEVGQERWTLTSDKLGEFSGEIVTAEAVDWEQAGIDNLLINAPLFHDEIDASNKVSDWQFTGAIHGTHTDEDGKIYLKFIAQATQAHSNDDIKQLSDWSLSNLSFGDESDVDGKLHVSVLKDPGSVTLLGGDKADIDEDSIILYDSYFNGGKTDNGNLYVTVEKDDTTYSVYLYDNVDRTGEAVAFGEFIETVPDTDWPAEITLEPGAGTSSTASTVGCLTLNSFGGDCPETDDEDSTIVIQVPRYFVRLYLSDARSEDELVSEAVSYLPQGTVTLTAQGDFNTSGTVDLNYVQDNEQIELTLAFYTIDAYKADPTEDDTTDDDIVARAGHTANLLAPCPQNDLEFYAVNSSGLDDATVDTLADAVSAGYIASAEIGYEVGDKFIFETSSGDEGRFQTFLRDNFDAILPSTVSGTPPSVPNSLSE